MNSILECTETAVALDGNRKIPTFSSTGCILYRVLAVILLFDFQSLTEVQNRFVCVTDLEILVDHPLAFP